MIKKLSYRKIELEMKKPFRIALGSTESYNGFIVKLETDDGFIGYGEATTTPFITGDTLGSIESELSAFSRTLPGLPDSPEFLNDRMKTTMRSSRASRNAVDTALWDIIGKRANLNLTKLLGNYRKEILTSYTVDLVDPSSAAVQAKDLLNQGIKVFKIKLGSGIKEDTERVRTVREVVGDDKTIYVDFNQSYTPKNAIILSRQVEEFNIEFLEQPTIANDMDALKFVRDNTTIPVFADESIFTLHDVADILSRDACDGINVKLMKSGGLTESIKIIDTAEAFGVPVMVGCMVETRLANTSGLVAALSKKAVRYADLDGYSNINVDILDEGIVLKDGQVTMNTKIPGTGCVMNNLYSL